MGASSELEKYLILKVYSFFPEMGFGVTIGNEPLVIQSFTVLKFVKVALNI